MKGNYWTAGLDIFGEGVDSKIPDDVVDVAIIGGGFSGASVFYHLGNRMSSVIIDAHPLCGMDGSSKGPGIVTWMNDCSISSEACQYSLMNNRMLERAVKYDGLDCRYHHDGHVYLSQLESGLPGLEAALANSDMAEASENFAMLPRDAIVGGVMSESFAGGAFLPSAFAVNPHLLVNSMVVQTRSDRNTVVTGSIVECVNREDSIFRITLKGEHHIFARKIVYCLGAYTPQLVPETEDVIDLKRNICIATSKVHERMFFSWPRSSMSAGYKWYRSTNGRVLSGYADAFTGEYDSPAVYRKATTDLFTTFPIIEATIKYNWVSLFGSTKTGPLVGPLPNRENEYVSTGYGNSSLSYAFLSGFIIADHLLNGGSDFPYSNAFSPEGRLDGV